MKSLKSFLPQISGFLSTTPAALYERQRQLVRLGILTAEEGHGPGSGVKLSADGVAALLVALLATDNLSDTDDRVRLLLNSRPSSKAKSAKTDAKTFRQAVATLLSSPQNLRNFRSIVVVRHLRSGGIYFSGNVWTWFEPTPSPGAYSAAIITTVEMRRDVLLPVSLALTAALGNQIKEE
jgi:hypothetical protein